MKLKLGLIIIKLYVLKGFLFNGVSNNQKQLMTGMVCTQSHLLFLLTQEKL